MKHDSRLEVPTSFTPVLFSVVFCVRLSVVQGKVRLWEVKGKSACYSGQCVLYSKTLGRQESMIRSYLLHLVYHHPHFQTTQKNSAYASFFYTQFENSNDVTPVQ